MTRALHAQATHAEWPICSVPSAVVTLTASRNIHSDVASSKNISIASPHLKHVRLETSVGARNNGTGAAAERRREPPDPDL